mgnify:CR=1 FL=1
MSELSIKKSSNEEVVARVGAWLADPKNLENLRQTFAEATRLGEELTARAEEIRYYQPRITFNRIGLGTHRPTIRRW